MHRTRLEHGANKLAASRLVQLSSTTLSARRRACPGISDLTAQVIVSEIGIDMSRFPTAGHLTSSAGLCPRNDESAGKRRSTRLRKGAIWLKTTFVQCAWAASRKKASYLQVEFQRLRHRRGPKKVICAGDPSNSPRQTDRQPGIHLHTVIC
jgi:transposase